jgi:hypothetical protein
MIACAPGKLVGDGFFDDSLELVRLLFQQRHPANLAHLSRAAANSDVVRIRDFLSLGQNALVYFPALLGVMHAPVKLNVGDYSYRRLIINPLSGTFEPIRRAIFEALHVRVKLFDVLRGCFLFGKKPLTSLLIRLSPYCRLRIQAKTPKWTTSGKAYLRRSPTRCPGFRISK